MKFNNNYIHFFFFLKVFDRKINNRIFHNYSDFECTMHVTLSDHASSFAQVFLVSWKSTETPSSTACSNSCKPK